jgi:hypothetical protein
MTPARRAPLVCLHPVEGQTGLREVDELLGAGDLGGAMSYLERVVENVERALTRRLVELEEEVATLRSATDAD